MSGTNQSAPADLKTPDEVTEALETEGKGKNMPMYYLWTFVGLAFIIFFRFIPGPDPINQTGMAMLGFFIGMIVLWSAVDMVWPTFIGICIFAFDSIDIYGPSGSNQGTGIYEAGIQSFGNWITLFVLGALILCYALDKVGTIRRITMWFITRKFAKKSAWTFTFMLWLSGLVIALFLDVTAAQIFMIMIAHDLFKELGFKKGDAWPRIVIIGITFTAIIGFTMTPICHTLPILFTGISASISHQPVNMLAYMLVGIPIGAVLWLIMFAWFRFVVKPDTKKLNDVNFDILDAKRPGPMDKREKLVVIVCILVVIFWVVPGFAAFLAPDSKFNELMTMLSGTFPLYLGIGVLGIIHVDKKPLLDIKEAFQNIEWLPVILLAGIMMIASAMGEDATGIPQWIEQVIRPMTEGLSPFMLVGVVGIICVILTNVANNVPVGIILVSAGTVVALELGINPAIIAVMVSIAANLAFTIPPAYVPVGFCYADPYTTGGSVFRNGLVMALVSLVVCFVGVYPLCTLFFGA